MLIINIDAPDVDACAEFYRSAIGLEPVRRLFDGAIVEMSLGAQLIHILPRPDLRGRPDRTQSRARDGQAARRSRRGAERVGVRKHVHREHPDRTGSSSRRVHRAARASHRGSGARVPRRGRVLDS